MVKNGKKIKINKYKDFKVYYGCIDNYCPKSMFINISCWAKPKEESYSYKLQINKLNKEIRQDLFKYLCNQNFFFKDNYIVDLDIRESGVNFNKQSFTCCEITLFQKNNHPINSQITKDELEKITDIIIKEILENNKYFNFKKRKTLID